MSPALRRILALSLAAGLALSISSACPAQPAGKAGAAPAAARAAGGDELPIRRITLYRSGVGFFQRDGQVQGDAKVPLRFKTDQVNDILKSLVLLDLGGGRIDAVSYSSKDPLDRRLASFGINIADNPAAGEILSRLRGTPVRLSVPEGDAAGTVMNVERRPTVLQGSGNGPTTVADLPWINLVTPKGIKSINLTTVTGFDILDKDLAEELNKALAALAEYRAESSKSVDLSFSGTGSRRVVVAYVHEMPVWKTSYRLILPDESGSSGTLHGWAIVENTTDQDWTDVRLALVAGRPVSFQMDLYEPLYTGRPMLPVPTVAGVMPRQYQEGVNLGLQVALADKRRDQEPAAKSLRGRAEMGKAGMPPAPASAAAFSPRETGAGGEFADAAPMDMSRALSAGDLSAYGAAAQAQAGSVGEVFQYELQNPVTIERQRSAMIPFLSSPMQSRRVSIFNLADRNDHPMRGVELKNTADLQLLPGPIAVFEGSEGTGSAYAGDATIGHIPQGDKRLLAYAVDLDVAVLTKPESTSTVTKLRISDGMLEQTVKQQNTVVYGFENKDAKRPRTILVEHPRLTDWTLVEPKEPSEKTQGLYRFELAVEPTKTGTLKVLSEKTQGLYRFELAVEPTKTGTLKVLQERTDSQRLQVMSFDMPTILSFRQQGKLSEAVVDAIKEVAKRQALINDAERSIAELDKQAQAIGQDQARIRENMKTIDRQNELYARYSKKLNEQETTLESLITQRAAAQATLEQRKNDLSNYLRTLNVE